MTTGPTFNRVGARCCRTTDADGSWGVAPSWRRSTRCSTARRHPVFVGRGFELERELPFAIWVDALDDHVATLGERRLEGLVGDRVGELARVLPSAGAGRGADRARVPRRAGAGQPAGGARRGDARRARDRDPAGPAEPGRGGRAAGARPAGRRAPAAVPPERRQPVLPRGARARAGGAAGDGGRRAGRGRRATGGRPPPPGG